MLCIVAFFQGSKLEPRLKIGTKAQNWNQGSKLEPRLKIGTKAQNWNQGSKLEPRLKIGILVKSKKSRKLKKLKYFFHLERDAPKLYQHSRTTQPKATQPKE